MTPPDNAPAPAAGGLFKKLTPKQKKVALVVGAAAVLAVIALLSKKGEPEAAPAEREEESQPREAFGSPVAAGATDPTAFLGAQSEDINAALGGVSDALGGVSGGLEGVTLGQDELSDQTMRADEGDRDRDEQIEGMVGGTTKQIEGVKKMLKAQREREKAARERRKKNSGGGGGKKTSGRSKQKKHQHHKPKNKHRKPRG